MVNKTHNYVENRRQHWEYWPAILYIYNVSDPDKECYYLKHVDQTVTLHLYNKTTYITVHTSVVELGIHIPPLFLHMIC